MSGFIKERKLATLNGFEIRRLFLRGDSLTSANGRNSILSWFVSSSEQSEVLWLDFVEKCCVISFELIYNFIQSVD